MGSDHAESERAYEPSASAGAGSVEQGGDPACWLERVCAHCGRLADDDRATRCPSCGAGLLDP